MSKRFDRRSLFQKMREWLQRMRPEPQGPPDFAERPVPVSRGPKGKSGAAVAEFEVESDQFYPPRRA
jgi:hypothetical protein